MTEGLKEEILARTRDDLEAIEAALRTNLNPYLEKVSEIAGHILFSGGKRVRPLLFVLCARLCGYTRDDDKTYSVIFEYFHTATLLHDDLVDDATVRRGNAVAHAVWDSASAVLVGDFLIARASSIAVKTGRMEIISILASVTEMMSQGEIHQLSRKGRADLTEEEYRTIIRNKTAVLMEGACRSGAVIAGASKAAADALAVYGMNLGMAFQMADDLLDYQADDAELGKKVGADLREGKFTLPLIHALAKADAGDAAFIREIAAKPDFTSREFDDLKGLLEKYGSIVYTEQCAADHVQKAGEALSAFPASETRALLEMLATYSMSRKT
ncbi:MAG: polyprenyl synthetase family protein [Thermodesulfobacteriota bacterium]|nr:polyprenyl synthetase family protein [Thermodesulfobacteriota bacterium]